MRSHDEEKTKELIDSLDIIDVTMDIAEKTGTHKKCDQKSRPQTGVSDNRKRDESDDAVSLCGQHWTYM
jgi:hypothetical protein